MKSKFLSILLILISSTHLTGQKKSEGKQYENLFPKPLKGWHASEVTIEVSKSLPVAGEYQNLTRKYYTKDGSIEVFIHINPDDQVAYLIWSILKKESNLSSFQPQIPDAKGYLLKDYGFACSNKDGYKIVRFVDERFGTVTVYAGTPADENIVKIYYDNLIIKPILNYINKEIDDAVMFYDYF